MSPEPDGDLAEVAFRLDLHHGRCVGVNIPPAAAAHAFIARTLLPEEQAHVSTLPRARRASWAAGRVALRAALKDVGVPAGPLLATTAGAPALPPGARGSISHKQDLAIGLAASFSQADPFDIGVDLEDPGRLPRQDIGRRVLTATERAHLATLGAADSARQTQLHFSLKEALYKAVYPHVLRFVSFQEAEVWPRPDGTAQITLLLAGTAGLEAEGRWLTQGSHLITTVRLRRTIASVLL